jgi:hypothetical protein
MDKPILIRSEMDFKLNLLKEIKVDTVNWLTYYIDGDSLENWVKEYHHSEYHGGGAPQLKKLDKFPWE